MSSEELEKVALAYTAKTSSASTPEQFLEEYITNKKLFREANAKQPVPKAHIRDRSKLGF